MKSKGDNNMLIKEYFENKIKEMEEQQEQYKKLPAKKKVEVLTKQLELAEEVISIIAKGVNEKVTVTMLINLARDYIRGNLSLED